MDENIIETSDDGRYRVRLEIDPSPENPRTFYDHITHVITMKNSRYIDVDQDGGPLQDGWDRLWDRDDAVDMFIRWARIFHGAVVVEHTPAEGARSLWYLLPEGLDEIGIPAEQYIQGDIEEYQAWAEGDVYRYVIEEAIDWGRRDGKEGEMTTWDVADSCGTYYGRTFAEQAARDALDIHVRG